MSFLQKAREAAGQAAEQARHAVDRATDDESQARMSDSMTTFGKKAREAAGKAKHGLSTVVERIDPTLLADLIIKATALQERTNRALHAKGSPYRITELVISASIPPGANFSIARVHDPQQLLGGARDSTEIVAIEGLEAETIISLSGDVEAEPAGMDANDSVESEQAQTGV
jgi:hypothetical protein